MPRWIPEKTWDGQDVFIIGGGPSLKGFDWQLLKPHRTIGCNDACFLGGDICKLTLFGDPKWFEAHKREVEKYEGIMFTNCSQLQKTNIPWLWVITRESSGLHENALGWNKNTGASAINLAIILGAVKIFLLGFDMHLSKDGKSNWHDNLLDKPNTQVYSKFLSGFEELNNDLKKKYPEVEVINVTDDSSLDLFPKIGVKEFWKGYANV